MLDAKRLRTGNLLSSILLSQKALEKQELIFRKRGQRLKATTVFFVALAAAVAIASSFTGFPWSVQATAIAAALALVVTVWRESMDFSRKAALCASAASEQLALSGKVFPAALAMLGSDDGITDDDLEELEERYAALCRVAPSTSPKAAKLAQKSFEAGDSRHAWQVLEQLGSAMKLEAPADEDRQ